MCRLAYIPEPFHGLEAWLNQLVASAGGDGCGVAVGKRVLKGVKVSVAQTVAAMHNLQPGRKGDRKPLPSLWHTRRTSSGGDSDVLCHPFACDGGWLAHNGHWHAMHLEAQKRVGPMSDSRLFAAVVHDRGFEAAVTELTPPGVWLHMRKSGRLAVWKSGGSLYYCPDLGAYGSEPSKGFTWYSVADGFTDYGDDPVRVREPRVLPNWYWRNNFEFATE